MDLESGSLDPKQVVEDGYDRVADAHLNWVLAREDKARELYTRLVLDRLPVGAKVLDLGCGAGLPTTAALASRFEMTGVDISARQVELARRNVPRAVFIVKDLVKLTLPPGGFDGIVAFYSLIHVPRDEYRVLLGRIARWLHPGGLLVATLGVHPAQDSWEDDWLGARMYWSSFDPETHARLLEGAGLRIASSSIETQIEFGQPASFQWVVAEVPKKAVAVP